MIKLLVGSKSHLDFDQPIDVTENQKKELIALLEKTFEIVEFESVNSFTRNRLGQQKAFPCKWTNKEIYFLCLPTKTSEDICLATGRSWFAIDHQRGSVNLEFSKWARGTGVDITTGFTPELVDRYMTEKVLAKKKKKSNEEKIKLLNDELITIKDKIQGFSTPRYRDFIELMKKVNPKDTRTINEIIKQKVDEEEKLFEAKKKRKAELERELK